MLLTLPQIEEKIREYTAIIDTPEEFIPTFGSSNQSGLAHIEINDGCYSLIVNEKGFELSRETFDNVDELIFKVLQDISFSMACDLVFEDTNDKNFRERFLHAQKNLISKVYLYYSDMVNLEKEILTIEDTKALSESRKKTLLKRKINKASFNSDLSSRPDPDSYREK
jgi:hypothetical protein